MSWQWPTSSAAGAVKAARGAAGSCQSNCNVPAAGRPQSILAASASSGSRQLSGQSLSCITAAAAADPRRRHAIICMQPTHPLAQVDVLLLSPALHVLLGQCQHARQVGLVGAGGERLQPVLALRAEVAAAGAAQAAASQDTVATGGRHGAKQAGRAGGCLRSNGPWGQHGCVCR